MGTPSSSESDALPPLHADVVIVGGGLVGGTLACALATHGVSVVLVDREAPPLQEENTYDGRSSAIAAGCQAVLNAAGVWPHMEPETQPILDIRVTDTDSPLFLHYDHRSVGTPMGWMAENRIIRRALHARFAELAPLTVLAPATVTTIERTTKEVRITLSDQRQITAALIVGADGRGSMVRQNAQIRTFGWPYHQSGIVLTIEHEQPHCGLAHERFLPGGPFAILPLVGGHRSSLVWTEETATARAIVALPEERFRVVLTERIGDFLGTVTPLGKRFCYPLSLQAAKRFIDKRLALVGDAAHGMHPVAGQGMNYGLRDVAALTEKLVEAKRLGLDLGSSSVLETYQRWRRFDTVLMLGLTDGVVRLFSNDHNGLRLARTLGLAAVERLPALKAFFMRHAMGLSGDVPKLMRGHPL